MSNSKKSLVHRPLSEYERKEVQWYPTEKFKIPRGKLTLFVGDPGDAKSFLLHNMIAKSTNEHSCKVVILSEDDPSDTIKPRIEDMGGKSQLVEVIEGTKTSLGKEQGFYLKTDLNALEEFVNESKPDLVLFDPLVSYESGFDPSKSLDVRQFLDPVIRLAAKCNFSLIGVIHLNKADTKAIYKITGSTQYVAVAKSIYLVARNPEPDESYDRVVCHLKINISRRSKSYTFKIQQDPVHEDRAWLEWGGESPLSADDVVQSLNSEAVTKTSKLAGCQTFTKGMLVRGPVPVTEWQKDCAQEGYSPATQKRARESLNVVSIEPDQPGPRSHYSIALPGYDEQSASDPSELNYHVIVQRLDRIERLLRSLINHSKRDEPPLSNEPPLSKQ